MLTTDRLLIRPIEETDWPAVRDIWAALAPLPMAQYDKPHNTDPVNVRARVARWADFTRLITARATRRKPSPRCCPICMGWG